MACFYFKKNSNLILCRKSYRLQKSFFFFFVDCSMGMFLLDVKKFKNVFLHFECHPQYWRENVFLYFECHPQYIGGRQVEDVFYIYNNLNTLFKEGWGIQCWDFKTMRCTILCWFENFKWIWYINLSLEDCVGSYTDDGMRSHLTILNLIHKSLSWWSRWKLYRWWGMRSHLTILIFSASD